ncbi:MAG: hypothetical protein JKY48_10200 [Flavobacteriales bacterium]|nr:hypothetical protein [Flavobacteriales bacterium]
MDSRVFQILELEEAQKYEEAFHEFEKLDMMDFDSWKYYYFYLWYINVEHFPLDLSEHIQKHQLAIKLKELAELGFEQFGENAEFQFLTGYTINLFPYFFGDYEEWEQRGSDLLKSAHELEPDNAIFNIAYQGSTNGTTESYNIAKQQAINAVEVTFNGKGFLNSYFTDVLTAK